MAFHFSMLGAGMTFDLQFWLFITSSMPCLVTAFRYYYQHMTAAWGAGTPLLPPAGKALTDERIEM